MPRWTAEELRQYEFRRKSPHLGDKNEPEAILEPNRGILKRVRQSSKPIMNKLETEFYGILCLKMVPDLIHCQAVTLRLANGVRYTPDFFVPQNEHIDSKTEAYEVKGKWFTDDSNVKLKMAASIFKTINFYLAWKDEIGCWQEQRILS